MVRFVSAALNIRLARCLLGLAGALAWLDPAYGAQTLGSYQHTAFRKQDGWPGAGMAAVTSDGFLWIPGNKGLTRYDGRRFLAFSARPGEALPQPWLGDVEPAQGGGLWIASLDGVTLLKDGHLTNFGAGQGYEGARGDFITDPAGTVWSWTSEALMRFDAGRWQAVYRTTPEHLVRQAAIDREGNIWALINRRLVVRSRDQSQFTEVDGAPDDARRVLIGRSDRIYVATSSTVSIFRHDGTRLLALALPVSARVYAMLESRDGSLWLGGVGQGLYFIAGEDLGAAETSRTSPRMQHMGQADGLSADHVPYLMEDGEGDIWSNTSEGLDRFRPAVFTSVKLPSGIHSLSSAVDAQGNLWVGSETHAVLTGSPGGELKETRVPYLSLAFFADATGQNLWVASPAGIWQLTPGTPRLEMAITFHDVGRAGAFPCMARNAAGQFYVCVPYTGTSHGLIVSDGDGWKDVFDHPVFPVALGIDRQDNLWVGSRDKNRLYKLSNGKPSLWDERQGLAVGTVRAIGVDGDTLWIGGDAGLQYLDGKRFVSLATDRPDISRPVTGIVTDRHGDLWIQTKDGVLRFRQADIHRFMKGAVRQVHAELFDDHDNVNGIPDLIWTNPNLRKAPDGTIWVQTSSALAWMDPDHIPVDQTRPTVVIDHLETSRHAYPSPRGNIPLAPDERAVRISFTSPALSRPDQLTFRYRLVGMSNDWTDAYDRRDASYTNLSPGNYRFEVIATNGSGRSSERVGAIDFERRPAYYETWWFRVLGVLPIALILWLVHDARSRSLARRLRIRSDEREAIARDIHDTLLQRLHWVLMSLQKLSSDPSIPSQPRSALAQIRDETKNAIVEGREQIGMLRRGRDSGLALYDELSFEGRRLQQRIGAAFVVEVHGSPRPLRNSAANELRDVALEAIRNAFVHSRASTIRVTLNYEDEAFWIVVSDDGQGFDQDVASKARMDGHFGLVGMRERISRLKGTINVESGPSEGTDVHVRVPASAIYEAPAARH